MVYFAPDAPLLHPESQKLSAVADEAYLVAETPLSVRESQTLSAVAARPSVANNELSLSLLLLSLTSPCSADSSARHCLSRSLLH